MRTSHAPVCEHITSYHNSRHNQSCCTLEGSVSQWTILWRYLSGFFSPPLLRPELLRVDLSKAAAAPCFSFSSSEAPRPGVPVELCRCGSGLLCAPASELLSSAGSFPWLPVVFSPILRTGRQFHSKTKSKLSSYIAKTKVTFANMSCKCNSKTLHLYFCFSLRISESII